MRKNMVRIFALILVLAMAVGFLAMIPAQATDSNAVQIVFNNVEYGEKLSLMYAVYGEEVNYETDVAVTLYTDAACTQKWCDATYSYTATEGKVANCGIFIAEKGVPAQAIDTVLYAKATMGENSSLVQRYSVLEYLHKRLSVDVGAGVVSAEQKTMYENLLDFAVAAQPVMFEEGKYTPMNSYTYVHVNNGTYKGYATGMYLQGGTIALSDLAADGTVLSWNYQIVGGESGTLTDALTIGTQDIILSAEIEEPSEPSEPVPEETIDPVEPATELTISFADTTQRVDLTTSSQVWANGDFTVTNNKGASTTNVADYSNPVRFYKNSTLIIAYPGMTKLVVTANNSTYATALKNSTYVTENVTATSNGKVVTILPNGNDSIELKLSADQVRLDAITVYVCDHSDVIEVEAKTATCTDSGIAEGTTFCQECQTYITGGVVVATGHQNTEEQISEEPGCETEGYYDVFCKDCQTVIESDVVIKALGHDYGEDDICANCGGKDPNAGATLVEKTITFNLGANGSATHKDGSSNKTSYSETVDGYTLNLTGGTNMYPSSIDAKGNGCIKLGSSSKTGGFTFTVDANVTKVIIYIGKYKANTSKVTINGTAYTLSGASNDGAYDAIEIDTTTNKTITVSTASGGVRAMVNTIEFVAKVPND